MKTRWNFFSLWILLSFCWIFLLNSQEGLAQDSNSPSLKRKAKIEWEAVEDSFLYEVEIRKLSSESNSRKNSILKKTKNNFWEGELPPGEYKMRLRSMDDREVFGEWSEDSVFQVKIPAAALVSPKDGATIQSPEEDAHEVQLEWKPAEGASAYLVEIFDSEGKSLMAETSSESSIKKELSVAKTYQWKVTTLYDGSPNLVQSQPPPQKFSILGKKLDAPKIEQPTSKFVTQLSWQGVKNAETYEYVLARKTPRGWVLVKKETDFGSTKIDLDPKAKGGLFRLQVRSKSSLRAPSDKSSLEFPVFEGERTPTAIAQEVLRESMELVNDHFFIASYYASQLSYSGANKESGSDVSYNVFGATGRLGYGYMPKGKMGIQGLADFSGIILGGKNYTYSSLEVQAIKRSYLWEVNELRTFGGLFAREIPEIRLDESGEPSLNKISLAGPHFGFQVWRPLSSKYGLQFNSQFYLGALKIRTPNGRDLKPSLSYQLALLGSYKINPAMMGYLGYSYRQFRASYLARGYDGGTEQNFASEGDINQVNMTGHFLNLYLEWGF